MRKEFLTPRQLMSFILQQPDNRRLCMTESHIRCPKENGHGCVMVHFAQAMYPDAVEIECSLDTIYVRFAGDSELATIHLVHKEIDQIIPIHLWSQLSTYGDFKRELTSYKKVLLERKFAQENTNGTTKTQNSQ